MPEIPTTLGSTRSIPQPVASVPRYDASIAGRGYARAAAITEQTGQALSDNLDRAAGNFRSAADHMDETAYQAAKSAFLAQKIQADTTFENDPDYATAPTRYRDAVGKIASETVAGITNPALKQKFIAETGYYAADGVATLQKAGSVKSKAARVDWLNESLATNMDTALAAKDPATRTGVQQSTMGMIDSEANAGLISSGEAARLKREWASKYAEQSIALLPPGERLAALLPGSKAGPSSVAAPRAPLPPAVSAAIDRGAKSDKDADLLKTFASIESAGDPAAVNPKSGAAGLFQFMPDTAKQYGVANPTNISESVPAAQRLLTDNRAALRSALGREPTAGEQYLAWQQGATGAAALLANPDKPAVTVLTSVYRDEDKAQAAIAQNGGDPNMTAGQFAQMWTAKAGDIASATPSLDTPSGGYDFSQKTGTAVDFIGPTERAKMIATAQADVKQQQQEQRQALQSQVTLGYADQKRNAFLTGKTDPAFNAQIMAAHPDATGAGYVADLNHEAEVGAQFNLIKHQTAAEDAAMQLRAKTAAEQAGPGSADAADTYARITVAIAAKQKDVADEIAADIKDSQGEAVDTINKNKADWAQSAANGKGVPDEARVAVAESGSPEAKATLANLEQLAALYTAGQKIKDQPLSADKSLIEKLGLDVKATGTGSADLAAQAKAQAEAIDQKQKAIAADPGGYFAAANDGVKSAWAAVEANPQDVAVAQTAAAMSVAAQRDYGLAEDQIQPFPNARAAQYAETITTAEPDKAMATIDQVRAVAGDQGLKQVLRQKGIPAMASFLAFADQPGQEPVRADALAAMKIKPEDMAKLVKARGVKDSDISDAVSSAMTPLLNTMTPGSAAPYVDAVSQLTSYYVSRGKTPAEGAALAWSAFDQAYSFHGTYRVPRQFDDQKVQNGMNAALQNLDKLNIVPQSGAPANAPAGYAQAQTIRQLQNGGARWVTNADDTGVILTYDVDQNGMPGAAVKTGQMRLSPGEAFARNQQFVKPGAAGFETKLPPADEAKFRAWVQQNNVPFDLQQTTPQDYDMRGLWKTSQDPAAWKKLQDAGKLPPDMAPAATRIDPNDGKPHWPDYWKTPYHETFSNESQWANDKAPHWTNDDKLVAPDGKVLFDDRLKAGRVELLFSDLEAGKYGSVFIPITPSGGLPQGSIGGGYSINPLGTMKPKGGRGQADQSLIDMLKKQ